MLNFSTQHYCVLRLNEIFLIKNKTEPNVNLAKTRSRKVFSLAD